MSRRQGCAAAAIVAAASASRTFFSSTTATRVRASPEAYERLVLDVLVGDRTLFPDAAEIEQSWQVIDPLEDAWAGTKPEPYRAGEWGPRASDEMLAREGRAWRRA